MTAPQPAPTDEPARRFALGWASSDHPDARLVISRDQWYATEAEADAAGRQIGTDLFMGENAREHGKIVLMQALAYFEPQTQTRTVRVLARSDLRAAAPAQEAMTDPVIAPPAPEPAPPAPAPTVNGPGHDQFHFAMVPPGGCLDPDCTPRGIRSDLARRLDA
jgi:hypothetical protein